jgi:hypothetical protein
VVGDAAPQLASTLHFQPVPPLAHVGVEDPLSPSFKPLLAPPDPPELLAVLPSSPEPPEAPFDEPPLDDDGLSKFEPLLFDPQPPVAERTAMAAHASARIRGCTRTIKGLLQTKQETACPDGGRRSHPCADSPRGTWRSCSANSYPVKEAGQEAPWLFLVS